MERMPGLLQMQIGEVACGSPASARGRKSGRRNVTMQQGGYVWSVKRVSTGRRSCAGPAEEKPAPKEAAAGHAVQQGSVDTS
jgi:hypothetical protein